MSVLELRCRECGMPHPLTAVAACPECWGALEPAYDLRTAASSLTAANLARRPPDLWRYRELLPIEEAPTEARGAGCTPLLPAPRLGRALGIADLWLKYEGTNFPTGSFKDRLVAVALARARRLGLETIACSSTGNLAIALGAAAARQGLRAVVFVPDDLDPSTLAAAAAFGPVLLGVRGGYDRANRLTAQLADRYPWAFLNVNLRAYYAEGAKTIGFEIAEQRGFRLPGHVVLPMASGSLLVKVEQAFRELVEVRLVPDEPCAVYGVQPSGCGPIVTAFERGTSLIDPVKPATLVKSLSLGDPADGPAAVAAIRRAKGRASAATDDESFEGLKLLARTEGLLAEPAGGTVVAAARRLAEGAFRDGRSVVLVIPARPSGSPGHEPASGFTSVIEPTLDAFDTFWRQLSVERGG